MFTKRIGHYYPVEWKLIPAPKQANLPDEMKKAEGNAILALLQKDDVLIALDEKGKLLDSLQVAHLIEQKANESTKNLVFLIGGAYGLADPVLKRANTKWSLSSLVFPHQLVRLILAEQIYRACSIIRNEKYHHE